MWILKKSIEITWIVSDDFHLLTRKIACKKNFRCDEEKIQHDWFRHIVWKSSSYFQSIIHFIAVTNNYNSRTCMKRMWLRFLYFIRAQMTSCKIINSNITWFFAFRLDNQIEKKNCSDKNGKKSIHYCINSWLAHANPMKYTIFIWFFSVCCNIAHTFI